MPRWPRPRGADPADAELGDTGWGSAETVPTIEFKNPLLLVGGKPFFLRSIDYNGESLARLQSLGFNAARLRQVPTGELLASGASGLLAYCSAAACRALEAKGATAAARRSTIRLILCWRGTWGRACRRANWNQPSAGPSSWRLPIRADGRSCAMPIPICELHAFAD